MKLFKTTDMQVVKMCREHFDFVSVAEFAIGSSTEKLCRLFSCY